METAVTERPETRSTALPSAWIDKLFGRFAAAYGTEKFASLWRGQKLEDVKAMWAAELSRFTTEELRQGFESLRHTHKSWPPTLYEFADVCRPEAAVNHEAAFYEAVRGTQARRQGKAGEWSSKAIYWASVDVSAFDLLGSTWPQMRARWIAALDRRLTDPNLPPIPEPALQLTASNDPPYERTMAGFDELVSKLKGDGREADPLAWARKIIERHEAGDTTITPWVLRSAYDAPYIAAGKLPPQ